MNWQRAALGVVSAAFLASACAHSGPPRTRVAEEPIVMAPAPATTPPLPEVDPAKPLKHAKEVHPPEPICRRTGRRSTTCK